jgi:DNA-binding CsgD family transcriptional regulator/uncharacterized membrane protein
MSGPLQLIVLSWPSSAQPDRVLAEVDRVQARECVRVLDTLLVKKDQGGEVVSFSPDESEGMGGFVSRLVAFEGAPDAHSGSVAAGLWTEMASLPPESSALFVLVEHRWARGIADAISEQGGTVFGADLLSADLAAVINADVAAVDDAVQIIDAAHAAEAEARLTAAAARAQADYAVTDSAQIRAEAAAETLRGLTTAGLVESAAIHEALDVLSAAELIIASANETAAQAWAADARMVAAVDTATDAAIAEDMAAIAAAEQKLSDVGVAASITPAELRVLRYLPTKLTYALIASRLGISRGAAKMRAERAYQKLGVHTSAEAVQRAHALRVLP